MAFHSSKRGHTHKKKHFRERKFQDQLIIPDESKNQYLGVIIKCLGTDARFLVKELKSEAEFPAKVTGKLIKGPRKQRIEINNIVLLVRENYNDNNLNGHYYIDYRYTKDEIIQLKKDFPYIDENYIINNNNDNDNDNIIFQNEDEEEIDIDNI